MAKQALTKRNYFPNYINIVDLKSQKYRPIGTCGTTSFHVIQAVTNWSVDKC